MMDGCELTSEDRPAASAWPDREALGPRIDNAMGVS